MFKNALAHVQQGYKALLVYAGIVAGYVALKVLIETLLLHGIDTNSPQDIAIPYYITAGLLDAFFYALASALAFPILGRQIDHPLWDFKPTLPNFLHFFSLWFTLYLISITSLLLITLTNIPDETKSSFIILWLLLQTLLLPIGATIMFYGTLNRDTIAPIIDTFLSQLPYYIATSFCTFLLYTVFMQFQRGSFPPVALPLLEIISAYAECLIFSFCWELCKRHRTAQEESDDLDF